MKYSALAAFAVPALASAHGMNGVQHHARLATTTDTAGVADNSAADSVAGAGATGTATTTLPTALTFSMISVNPTALPLSDIVTGTAQLQSTIAISSTYAAGAKPTKIPNAPGIPAGNS